MKKKSKKSKNQSLVSKFDISKCDKFDIIIDSLNLKQILVPFILDNINFTLDEGKYLKTLIDLRNGKFESDNIKKSDIGECKDCTHNNDCKTMIKKLMYKHFAEIFDCASFVIPKMFKRVLLYDIEENDYKILITENDTRFKIQCYYKNELFMSYESEPDRIINIFITNGDERYLGCDIDQRIITDDGIFKINKSVMKKYMKDTIKDYSEYEKVPETEKELSKTVEFIIKDHLLHIILEYSVSAWFMTYNSSNDETYKELSPSGEKLYNVVKTKINDKSNHYTLEKIPYDDLKMYCEYFNINNLIASNQ